MKHRTISLVIGIASICFTLSSLHAIERKNIFKIVAAVAAASVFTGTVVTDTNPIATLYGAGRAFSDGVLACSLVIGSSRAGGYMGNDIDHIGVYAGTIGGGMLGDKIASMTVGTSMSDIIIDNPSRRNRLERITESVGCFCGSKVGLAAAELALNQ